MSFYDEMTTLFSAVNHCQCSKPCSKLVVRFRFESLGCLVSHLGDVLLFQAQVFDRLFLTHTRKTTNTIHALQSSFFHVIYGIS